MALRFWLRTFMALCLIVCVSGYTLAATFSLLARLTASADRQSLAPACAQQLPQQPPSNLPVQFAYSFGKRAK